MARRSEGWHLRWRGGVAYVRWTQDGRRRSLCTGEKDPHRARVAAARLYTEALAGQKRQLTAGLLPSQQKLSVAIAAWIDDLDATHDAGTAYQYQQVAKAQWLSRWSKLGEITASAVSDYQRDRLREVTRETTRKHMVALRTFLAWCKTHALLVEVPELPTLPERATGVRSRKASRRVPIPPAQIAKLIAALPVLSTDERRSGEQRYRVRDWAIVAWETALRPSTLAKLRLEEHWKRGKGELVITPEIDKIRFERAVPITARAREVLTRCAAKLSPGALLLGLHDYDPYLEEKGLKVLKRAVHAYDFRHSRLTALVRSGRDLLGVQFLAGHRSLSTTAKYAHPSAEAARRALRTAG